MRKVLFMIAYYGASAVYQGYMGLFYEGIGLNRTQIGMVNASAAVSALAVQPLWGSLGDKLARRKLLLAALSLASALILPLALLKKQLLPQMLVSAAFFAFYSALLPMGDAVALSTQRQFGKIRLFGGISYAAFSLLGGWLLGRKNVRFAVWSVAGMLLLSAISALLLPENAQKREQHRLLPALREKKLRKLLLFMLPSQIGMGFFYGFFALRFMSLSNASHTLLGVANLMAAVAELPYLIFSDRIFERFGAGKTMLVATAALSLRFFLLGMFENAYVALLSQMLNGIGYIAISVSMAKYIAQQLPENAAGGQALISLLFYGAARLIGSLLGGIAAESIGIGSVFLILSGVNAAAFLLYALCK